MDLITRNMELINEVVDLKAQLAYLKSAESPANIFKLDKEVRTLREIIKKNKKEHCKEYKILWNQNQKLMQKLLMIRDFTQNLTEIYPTETQDQTWAVTPTKAPGVARKIKALGVSFQAGK